MVTATKNGSSTKHTKGTNGELRELRGLRGSAPPRIAGEQLQAVNLDPALIDRSPFQPRREFPAD